MNPLHASHYADYANQQVIQISENEKIARDTYRLRFEAAEMARRIVPGQFFMLRAANVNDPLLGRAFALYDTVVTASGEPWGIDVVYLVVGKLTKLLSTMESGQPLVVWGPLGNGFASQAAKHLIMVAGGIGQTPFMALAREYLGLRKYGQPVRDVEKSPRVSLCYGSRSADLLAGVDEFRHLGVDVHLATDDGSVGHHGLVTEVLDQLLVHSKRQRRIVCCGPEPMMEAVAHIAARHAVPCQVSLETPMACGIGICFSCVAKVRDADGSWDYKRTCVEGPVFEAAEIEW